MKFFPPFQFDERLGALTRAGQAVALTRKASEVLACLVARPGDVVSHSEILERVWAGTHVQSDNIKVLVRELRQALADDSRHPRFIRADPGRGYSFIGHVTDALPPVLAQSDPLHPAPVIGRETEQQTLHRHLRLAMDTWVPQLVLVSGDHRLGKTHLCRSFVRDAAAIPNLRVSGGQGLDVARTTVDLALMLEALDGLERQYPVAIPNVLARCAPTRRSALTFSSDTPHIFRELSVAFDKIAADAPLVLVLEDIHWADAPTLDFVRALGRRQPYARLCIVATYASSPDLAAAQAVMRLLADWPAASASALALRPWTETDLRTFLESQVGTTLGALLHPSLCSAGGCNPAMAVATVEHLRRRAVVVPTSAGWQFQGGPTDLRELLELSVAAGIRRVTDGLAPADRRLLELAAEAGPTFTAATVESFAEPDDPAEIDTRLELMAAAHMLIEPMSRRRGPIVTPPMYQWRHRLVPELLRRRDERNGMPIEARLSAARGRGRLTLHRPREH